MATISQDTYDSLTKELQKEPGKVQADSYNVLVKHGLAGLARLASTS